MIHLTTGQPGAGKTLYTLWSVQQMAEREGRQVFYSGINDLRLPWIELTEPEKWFELPTGAIIVIDECQRIFRPRVGGSKVPESVARMETHRHNGHDLFLITQHPMLLDSNIRRLVGSHRHVVRAFGAKAANVHEWGEVRDQPDKNRTGSQETFWKYPKEVFEYYKSAELHTHKFRLPPRVYFLLLAPILVGACVWAFYGWWKSSSGVKAETDPVKSLTTASASAKALPSSPAKTVEKMTVAEYVADQQPRIPGLPHTAPMYDDVTRAADAPVPVGCMESKRTGCKCYTQQGTLYETSQDICRNVMKNGFYIAWKRPEPQQSPQQVSHAKPEPPAPVAENTAPGGVIGWQFDGSHNSGGGLSRPPSRNEAPAYSLVPKG